MKYVKWAACFVVLALGGGVVFNQEVGKDKKPDDKSEAKPATHKVVKKPFKIELSVSGILSAEEAVEISYRPHPMLQPADGQSSLTIKQVAAHGAKVKKGETLAVFDTTKMNEVIENAEVEQKTLLANIKLAEQELPLAEKVAPLDVALAESAKKRADEELKYFLDVAKDQTVKDANSSLKFTKFMLEYAEDELTQLKKMYKANDLTEETERMIMRRQRHYVERIAAYVESAVLERDYLLKFTLPNKEKSLKEDQAKHTLLLEKAQKSWAPWLLQKQAALIKMHHDHDKSAARLAKMVKDRTAMTITSPIDGVVYHGKFQQGTWTAADSADSKLMPGSTVSPDRVFITVLKPGPLELHLTVEEKEVHLLKPDMKGTAKLAARPDRKLSVRVAQVSAAPTAPGKFAALVRFDAGAGDLVPGLACTVKFVPYSKKDAIAVPTKYLEEEDGKDVVHVLLPNGKHETRPVTLGRADSEQTEVLAGLREGDEVLLERPASKTTAKDKGAKP